MKNENFWGSGRNPGGHQPLTTCQIAIMVVTLICIISQYCTLASPSKKKYTFKTDDIQIRAVVELILCQCEFPGFDNVSWLYNKICYLWGKLGEGYMRLFFHLLLNLCFKIKWLQTKQNNQATAEPLWITLHIPIQIELAQSCRIIFWFSEQ